MSAVKKLDVTVNLWQGEAVRHKERLRDRMKGGGGRMARDFRLHARVGDGHLSRGDADGGVVEGGGSSCPAALPLLLATRCKCNWAALGLHQTALK